MAGVREAVEKMLCENMPMIFGALCSIVTMLTVLLLELEPVAVLGAKECLLEEQNRKLDPNEQFEVLLAPFSPFSN
jgi:hypothetical protein